MACIGTVPFVAGDESLSRRFWEFVGMHPWISLFVLVWALFGAAELIWDLPEDGGLSDLFGDNDPSCEQVDIAACPGYDGP
jgi:hypothetical protein